MSVDDGYIANCLHCEGEIKDRHLAEKAGGLEIYDCPLCGKELGLTVSHDDAILRLNETFELLLEWPTGRPDLNQIRATRKLLPSLAKVPLGELKKQMDTGRAFELGRFIGGEAVDLMNRANEFGLPIKTRRVLEGRESP